MRQIFEHHPRYGFRFIPGIRARIPHEGGGYLVRSNASGFRDDAEFAAERTPGRRRVLLFGDSFTAGEGVSSGQRYGDWLSRLLPDLDVYNFGMPATGTDQHYLIYREHALEIEHDVLVIAVFVDNIRRVDSRYRWFTDDRGNRLLFAKPYYLLDAADQLQLHGVPVEKRPIALESLAPTERSAIARTERFPRLKRGFARLRQQPWIERVVVETGLRDRLLKALSYQPIPEYDDAGSPAWRIMRAVLQQWITGHDRPVMLMPIPIYHHVAGLAHPGAYQARLREVADATGALFFDPLPSLSRHDPAQRRALFFPVDGHLTAAGHEALAAAMAPAIDELLRDGAPGATR